REDYDLPLTPIVWLTSSLGQNRLTPMPPEILERVVRDFITQQPNAVVALGGVEYMSNYVNPERLVRCLPTVRGLVTSGGGVLLVSAELGSVQERMTSTVARDFVPCELLAEVGRGRAPAEMRDERRVLLERAERRYGPMMARWSGEVGEVAGLQAMTSRLFL